MGFFDWLRGKPKAPVVPPVVLRTVTSWGEIAPLLKLRDATICRQMQVAARIACEANAAAGAAADPSEPSEKTLIRWLEAVYAVMPAAGLRTQLSFMLGDDKVPKVSDTAGFFHAFGKENALEIVREVAKFFRRPVRIFDVEVYVLAVLGADYDHEKLHAIISSHVRPYRKQKRNYLVSISADQLLERINVQRYDTGDDSIFKEKMGSALQANLAELDKRLPESPTLTRAGEKAARLRSDRAHRLIVYVGEEKACSYPELLDRIQPLFTEQKEIAQFCDRIHSDYEYFY